MSVKQFHDSLTDRLADHFFGVDEVIRWLSIALIARGHVLMEGAPGTGKTSLARALAQCLGGEFGRVQCTADLMPSDMTGVRFYNESTGAFEMMRGPLFSDVVIVDEINRTSPKTQSAMLEAMEEGAITIDRETYSLPDDFFVIATQNPHEFEGTYPLPESQIDRFLVKLAVTYPATVEEVKVLRTYGQISSTLRKNTGQMFEVVDTNLLAAARAEADNVEVSEPVYQYMVALAEATRTSPQVSLGLSTRGLLAMIRCARILAAMEEMTFVTPDHIKQSLDAVVAHRLVLTQDALFDGFTASDVLRELVASIEVPRQ